MSDENQKQIASRRDAEWPELAGHPHEDEISLYDLWFILAWRRWQILVVVLVVFALFIAYAFTTPDKYRYSLIVEIGSQLQGGELRPVETPQTVVAKLRENYVAGAISRYLEAHPDIQWEPEIKASVPEGSGIVVLSAEAAEDRQAAYFDLLQSSLARLQKDHERIIETARQELELRIEEARNKAANAADELATLKARRERLAERAKVVRNEIDALEALIVTTQDDRRQATRTLNSEAQAMTLLMLSNEIRESRKRLSDLRTILNVDIPQQRDALDARIAEQQRQVEALRGEADLLQVRLDNMKATLALSPPQRSLRPVGTGDAIILVLGLILGGMLGVFFAFLAEFVSRANAYMKASEEEVAENGSQTG